MARGSALQNVLAALEKIGSRVTPRGGYYVAQCPAHDDRTASLSFSQGEKGARLKCHAGCEVDVIRTQLDLPWAALFDSQGDSDGGRGLAADLWMPCQAGKRDPKDPGPCSGHKAAEYRYTDEDGILLYAVARCSRKGDGCTQPFAQWIPDSTKKYGKKWGLPGTVRRVLYDLARVIQAARDGKRIWILEGEKDVERMKADFPGEVATTAMSGAGNGKWLPGYTKHLAGAGEVIIVADCDEPGLKYAEEVHRHVSQVVSRVRVVCSPLLKDGADFSDHRDYGFGLDDFEIVPFERITTRPRMVIQVEDRHREEPVVFEGFSQDRVERSLVGSILKQGVHYEINPVDIRSSKELRTVVEAISRIAARESLIIPEAVAVEIEAAGKGPYETWLKWLTRLERCAFDDTEKPRRAARILQERSIREGVVYACRAMEDVARNERWPLGEVLDRMRDLTSSHERVYAELARSYGAPTGDVFTGDVVEEIAREEGVTGVVHELRPTERRRRETAARTS